ncbi:translation initiation factor IF-3 [Patescibacteria group bacterium]|nr:translation initiation factor IF-3 [Patescibacteria group bacterium]
MQKPNTYEYKAKTRINHAIRARELRVVGPTGENLGVLTLEAALKAADDANLDLIEISPNAKPPVAKIMDFGKYRYDTGQKESEMRSKSHVTETKSVQVKIGTGDNDQMLKANKAADWLEQGHRVKVDLFLWGRYKYMEPAFLKERLDRFLKIIPTEYKVADEMKKSPKGYTTTLERMPGTKTQKLKDAAKPVAPEPKKVVDTSIIKSKKKNLDELLDAGMI